MKYFLLHQVIRDWKTQGFACQQLECRSFIIKHFQIAHFSPRSAPSISRPEKRFIFPTVDDSSALERLWMAAPNAIQLKPLPVYQENTNQFSQELNGIHPTIYLINPEPRQKRQTQNKQKKAMVRRVRGRRGGDCMPLTITFPVFFCAHTLGKTFRAISPAHTVLHKQRQED